MDIKRTAVLDGSDSLSKALAHLDGSPAVLVTKSGKYFGLIDHRSVSSGIRDPKNVRCENVAIKPPVLSSSADLLGRVEAFMVGHFKALPVVDANLEPLGITTRVEVLQDMIGRKLIPPMKISELMSRPVFTIDENETVASARKALKENRAHRLVVTRRGNPVGIISVFDMGAWDSRPNLSVGRKNIKLGDSISVADMKISGFIRPDITTIDEGASLQDAVAKMVEKEVSAVIVVLDRTPAGVLSALDVFRAILDMARESMPVQISGLSQDDIHLYSGIKEKITHVLGKYKGFNFRNVSLHVKEDKSCYEVSIYFDTDKGHVSMKEERATIGEAVDALANEIGNVLRKKKERRRIKPRATHARGRRNR